LFAAGTANRGAGGREFGAPYSTAFPGAEGAVLRNGHAAFSQSPD